MVEFIDNSAVFTVSFIYETILIPYYELQNVFYRANVTSKHINKARASM